MKVIERTAAHYDVQEVEFGTVYRWCPETAVVECECGERETFKWLELAGDSVPPCGCGVDLTVEDQEYPAAELLPNEDERNRHP